MDSTKSDASQEAKPGCAPANGYAAWRAKAEIRLAEMERTTPDCKPDAPGVIRCTALLCHVRMFKPQFAPLVESGAKCQTVRPTPKRMPKPGDRISLRMWTGKPYRSKQRVLRESEISAVERITICDTGRELLVGIGNKSLNPEELNAFAAADGFRNGIELVNWFEATHGLPFDGVVIKWHNAPDQRPGATTI